MSSYSVGGANVSPPRFPFRNASSEDIKPEPCSPSHSTETAIKTEAPSSPQEDGLFRENIKIEPDRDEPQAGPSGINSRQAAAESGSSHFEDPLEGPSGINVRSMQSINHDSLFANGESSDDDDDDHEIMQTTSAWRSRGSFNLNHANRLNKSESTSNEASGNIDSGLEILTAPDLQLDWVSDSSEQSLDDVVFVPMASPAGQQNEVERVDAVKTERAEEPRQATFQIDLTTDSDDEDVMEVNISNREADNLRQNRLSRALYDVYHNETRDMPVGGNINCRSATYGTCDCLEPR